MSTNDPLTQEQLDAIQERVDSVEFPDDEHLTVVNGEENLVSWVERSHRDGSVVSGAVVATVHAGPRSAEMFAHAPEDLADLLAEVHRLREELAKAREVTEDKVERAKRAFGAATAVTSSIPIGMSEHTFIQGVSIRHGYAVRIALYAALGGGDNA